LGRRRWGGELIGGFPLPTLSCPRRRRRKRCRFVCWILQKRCRKKAMVFLFIKRFQGVEKFVINLKCYIKVLSGKKLRGRRRLGHSAAFEFSKKYKFCSKV
jgi:hypothetical protein